MTKITARPDVEKVMDAIIQVYRNAIEKSMTLYRQVSEMRSTKNSTAAGIVVSNIIAQSEIDEKIQEYIRESQARILFLQRDYEESETVWQTAKSAEITDDEKLLSGKFSLSERELLDLAETHKANYTMLYLINAFMMEHEYSHLIKPIQGVEARADLLDGFIKMTMPRFTEQCTSDSNYKMDFDVAVSSFRERTLNQVN